MAHLIASQEQENDYLHELGILPHTEEKQRKLFENKKWSTEWKQERALRLGTSDFFFMLGKLVGEKRSRITLSTQEKAQSKYVGGYQFGTDIYRLSKNELLVEHYKICLSARRRCEITDIELEEVGMIAFPEAPYLVCSPYAIQTRPFLALFEMFIVDEIPEVLPNEIQFKTLSKLVISKSYFEDRKARPRAQIFFKKPQGLNTYKLFTMNLDEQMENEWRRALKSLRFCYLKEILPLLMNAQEAHQDDDIPDFDFDLGRMEDEYLQHQEWKECNRIFRPSTQRWGTIQFASEEYATVIWDLDPLHKETNRYDDELDGTIALYSNPASRKKTIRKTDPNVYIPWAKKPLPPLQEGEVVCIIVPAKSKKSAVGVVSDRAIVLNITGKDVTLRLLPPAANAGEKIRLKCERLFSLSRYQDIQQNGKNDLADNENITLLCTCDLDELETVEKLHRNAEGVHFIERRLEINLAD